MLELFETSQFKKDCRRLRKRGKDMAKLDTVIELLCSGEPLPEEYRDHELKGQGRKYRECHIESFDWVLKYQIEKKKLVLIAMRTGTHQDVFGG